MLDSFLEFLVTDNGFLFTQMMLLALIGGTVVMILFEIANFLERLTGDKS